MRAKYARFPARYVRFSDAAHARGRSTLESFDQNFANIKFEREWQRPVERIQARRSSNIDDTNGFFF